MDEDTQGFTYTKEYYEHTRVKSSYSSDGDKLRRIILGGLGRKIFVKNNLIEWPIEIKTKTESSGPYSQSHTTTIKILSEEAFPVEIEYESGSWQGQSAISTNWVDRLELNTDGTVSLTKQRR
jgi:hypothetical protein